MPMRRLDMLIDLGTLQLAASQGWALVLIGQVGPLTALRAYPSVLDGRYPRTG